MKNIINTIKATIGLDTILIIIALAIIFTPLFISMSVSDEVSYADTEETFRTECYKRFEEAMDYLYEEDYSEYNVEMAKLIARNSFTKELNQNEELISDIWFPSLYIDDMVEEFTTRYQFGYDLTNHIYPYYMGNNVLMVKEEPKSRIAHIMDELQKEFSQDHIVEREGNSMWIEPIEDKPVLEQKLVSIEDVDKPVLEQELVNIKNINE